MGQANTTSTTDAEPSSQDNEKLVTSSTKILESIMFPSPSGRLTFRSWSEADAALAEGLWCDVPTG